MTSQGPQIRIKTQFRTQDIEDLTVLLRDYSEDVTLREVHPGPQANVDLFLQPAIEMVMNYSAAHPLVGVFLASIPSGLIGGTARKIAEKFKDKLPDVLVEKALDKAIDFLKKYYKRGEEAERVFVRGETVIPVPAFRMSLDLNAPVDDSKPRSFVATFPTGLSDAQFHDACILLGKVADAAIRRTDELERVEAHLLQMFKENRPDEVTNFLMENEEYHKMSPTPTYGYRPEESAWVDAHVLATQKETEKRADLLRREIRNPSPSSQPHLNEFKKMLAEIEKEITDARIS